MDIPVFTQLTYAQYAAIMKVRTRAEYEARRAELLEHRAQRRAYEAKRRGRA